MSEDSTSRTSSGNADLSSADWTLESELCKLSNRNSLQHALLELGILKSDDPFELSVVRDWTRSGAETYLLRFRIAQSHVLRMDYVLKACVALPVGQTVDQILQRWIQRRAVLEEAGVGTPELIASGNGVLLEEYIPHSVSEMLAVHPERRFEFARQLAEAGGIVEGLSFSPLRLFDDLRSRGLDVVTTDFGEDLGPQGVSGKSLWSMLRRYLDGAGVPLSDTDFLILKDIYDEAAHRATGFHS